LTIFSVFCALLLLHVQEQKTEDYHEKKYDYFRSFHLIESVFKTHKPNPKLSENHVMMLTFQNPKETTAATMFPI